MNSVLDILEANEPTISAFVGLLTICAGLWGAVQLAIVPFFEAQKARADQSDATSAQVASFDLWSSLVNRGVDPRADFIEQISGRTLNACLIALIGTTLALLTIALLEKNIAISLINLFMFLMGIVAYNIHSLGRSAVARWVLIVSVMLYWNLNIVAMGTGIGLEYILGGVLLLPLLLFERAEKRQSIAASVLIVISLPIAIIAEAGLSASWPFNAVTVPPLYYLGNAIVLGGLVFLAMSFYNRSADSSFRALEDQEQKSSELIHALVPAYIAEKMSTRSSTVADWHSEASVLFATVVGFEHLYKRVSAVQLVELLRQLFEEFDELVSTHSVEKINTLGTNYVAATGIDVNHQTSTEQLVRVAIGMREVVNQLSTVADHPFGVRIGISTGDVVSGVVGEDRPSFDIWGRTVELAHSMRDDAADNTIVVNEAAYWRLKQRFRLEKRAQCEGTFLLIEEK